MRADKQFAIELRKSGLSYNDIGARLGIPKSTIAYWFRGLDWSKDIKAQLEERARKISSERLQRLITLRKNTLAKWYEEAEREAKVDFYRHKETPLFIAGIMLYWGEGDKKFENGHVKLGNTDRDVIRLFKQFLEKFGNCTQDKIRGWLLLYPDLNERTCVRYWSRCANLPEGNFTKSTVIDGRHKSHRLPYGTCTLTVSSKYFKKKILTWIDLYRSEF